MLLYLAILGLGIVAGVFTGLIPGIHPNTIVFITLPFYFSSGINFLSYMSFVAGLAVSHTFHDFLPSIFLGVPEAESALSAVPGAKLALEGRGLEAFSYTVYGGIASLVAITALVPFFFLFLDSFYSLIEPFMMYILVFFLSFIVFRSDHLLPSALTAILAGTLGILSFASPVNQEFVLIPVFTGLFASPSIIHALRSGYDFPEQLPPQVDEGKGAAGGLIGTVSGFAAGIFPGLGPAVSTSFLTPLMSSRKQFLAGMGAVNTSDAVVSFLTLVLIGKPRSGASVALQSIGNLDTVTALMLVGLSLLAASVSGVVALQVSRPFTRVLESFPVDRILAGVFVFVFLVNAWLTGLIGLLVFSTASFIGYSAFLSEQRDSCMAVLLLPAILHFSGLTIM